MRQMKGPSLSVDCALSSKMRETRDWSRSWRDNQSTSSQRDPSYLKDQDRRLMQGSFQSASYRINPERGDLADFQFHWVYTQWNWKSARSPLSGFIRQLADWNDPCISLRSWTFKQDGSLCELVDWLSLQERDQSRVSRIFELKAQSNEGTLPFS